MRSHGLRRRGARREDSLPRLVFAKTVKVWDTGALPPLITLPMPAEYDTTVAFSPDGKRLLAAIGNGTVKVVAVESGKETLSVQYDKDRDSVRQCAAWSPDGRRFAVRVRPDNVVIADADTGKQLLPLLPCGDEVRSLAWSPDGTILAAGVVRSASTRTCQTVLCQHGQGSRDLDVWPRAALCGRTNSVAWRPDGTRLAAAGTSLRVWDPASLQGPPVALVSPPRSGQFTALSWSPDGKRLAAGRRE